MVISFSGTHCTGKSTFIENLKNVDLGVEPVWLKSSGRELKKEHPDLNINENGDFNSQLYFMVRDVARHMESAKAPVVFCDRSIIDTFVYTWYLRDHGEVTAHEFDIIRRLYFGFLEKYPFDCVFLFTPSFDLVKEENRSMNKAFQDEIKEMFDIHVEQLSVVYDLQSIYMPSTFEERVEVLKRYLSSK